MDDKASPVEEHTWSFYMRPSNFTKIVNHKLSIFGVYSLVGYIG
jgi:hypothetical protein